jgi:serine/threonine protein kinase
MQPSPADSPKPLEFIGRFQVHTVLGEGASGRVLLAHDPVMDRPVAIKIPLFANQEARSARKFLREASLAARLKHPNLVAIFEVSDVQGQPLIVSEYVPGCLCQKCWQISANRLPAWKMMERAGRSSHPLQNFHAMSPVRRKSAQFPGDKRRTG